MPCMTSITMCDLTGFGLVTQSRKCKGAPPIAADPGGFPDFRILILKKNVNFGKFPVEFGVCGGL